MKLCARIGTPFSLAALTAVMAELVPMGLMLIAWTPFSSSCWTVVTKAWKSPSLAGACTSMVQPSFSLSAVAPSTIATWNGLVSAGGTKPTLLEFRHRMFNQSLFSKVLRKGSEAIGKWPPCLHSSFGKRYNPDKIDLALFHTRSRIWRAANAGQSWIETAILSISPKRGGFTSSGRITIPKWKTSRSS